MSWRTPSVSREITRRTTEMAEQYCKEITAKRVEEDETVQDGATHREGFYKLESSPSMFPLCFVLFILLENSPR